jgi:putative flippase GtrA
LINLAVFAALAEGLGVPHAIAAIAAFSVAVTNNFLGNRYWTFAAGGSRAAFQAPRFFLVSLVALGVDLAVLEILLRGEMVGEVTAQAIAIAVATPFNFVGNKLWTFNRGVLPPPSF